MTGPNRPSAPITPGADSHTEVKRFPSLAPSLAPGRLMAAVANGAVRETALVPRLGE